MKNINLKTAIFALMLHSRNLLYFNRADIFAIGSHANL